MADRTDAGTHDFSDECGRVDRQRQGQRQQFRDQHPATDEVEALELRHFPVHRAAKQHRADTRDADQHHQPDPELVERLARLVETLVGLAHHQRDRDNRQHHGGGERPEAVGHRRARHVQATVADEEGVVDIDTAPRSRQGQEHREVPEQDLQQRRDVAKGLHIHGRQLVDHPVRRQPRHTDDETQERRQDDADERHQQGVQQADDEHPCIAVGFHIGNQVLGDAKAGTAVKEVEAGGDTPVLQVGLGVVEQVPAQTDHEDDREDLEQPRAHTWIAKG
ncbi:hypothetical protein D3C81_1115470 [compost metagenome]